MKDLITEARELCAIDIEKQPIHAEVIIEELCDALEKAQEQNKWLVRELSKLACESVERDKALARLEAEVEDALREKQERDRGCEWCNPNPYGHGEAIRPLISQVFNDKAQISTMISGAGLHTLAVPSPEDTNLAKRYSKCQIIHFCPMCGRELEEHHEAD